MLDLDCYFIKGVLIFKLKGTLNEKTSNILNNKVANLLNAGGFRNALFNLVELNEIDRNGYNSLLFNCNKIKHSGGKALFFGIDKYKYSSKEFNVDNEINILNNFNI